MVFVHIYKKKNEIKGNIKIKCTFFFELILIENEVIPIRSFLLKFYKNYSKFIEIYSEIF